MGTKKRPFYRIVAADSRRARDGRFLEVLGTYNPITQPAEVKVFENKLIKWLDQGAIPSDTVGSLLTQIGFGEKYEKHKKGEDVSEITLRTTIVERRKKTRKMKKAAVKTEAEAPAEAATETAVEKPAKVPADAQTEASSEGADNAPADS